MKKIFIENFRLKLFSLFTAIVMYFLISVEIGTTKVVDVPFQINLAADILHMSEIPNTVKVTYQGPLATLRSWNERVPMPYILDLREQGPGTVQVTLALEQIPSFAGLKPVQVMPSHLQLQLDRQVERRVPVSAHIVGEPAHGYIRDDAILNPETVIITGPSTEVNQIDTIFTKVIDIEGATIDLKPEVELKPLNYPLQFKGQPPKITVMIPINEELLKKSVRVPIAFESDIPTARLKTRSASITVRGPKRIIDKMDVKQLRLVVSTEDLNSISSGTVAFEPELQGLPEGAYMISTLPSAVVEYLTKKPGKGTPKRRKAK